MKYCVAVMAWLAISAGHALGAPAVAQANAPLSFAGLTLAQAQQDAVAHSPDVAIARAKEDAAAATLAAAHASLGPSLIATYALNPQALPPTTVTQTAFNLGVQATLLSFAQYLPLLDQAAAADRVARADEAAAERAERIRVSQLYFAALKAAATLQAQREALALASAQLQAAQKRFGAGDAPHLDVVRAEVAAAQALAATENAEAANANASQALAVETNLDESQISLPAPGVLPPVPAAGVSIDTALQRAMTERADVLSAQANVAAASAGVNAARAANLPAVTVSAGYEHGIDTGQAIKGPTINASFELPLNGSQTTRISDAQTALIIARSELDATRRSVTVEVASAVRTLNAAMLATAASTKARQAAEEELNATTIGYRTGATSSLERTAASATYADARLSELSAIYDEALARAVVELELGP